MMMYISTPKRSCTWMMYIDVDEFVFSPSRLTSLYPLNHILRSLPAKTIIIRGGRPSSLEVCIASESTLRLEYVVDWTQEVNPMPKNRTPDYGLQPPS
uniref:Glycosyltransferase family 92 protein n=1 Tax=Nelumbo nucifera TaxID=4432 RepID=A0A822YP95_NELNU|nr:TPA_asm: hypothetical protein HUJ06_012000 [Nelumbo nucifera]